MIIKGKTYGRLTRNIFFTSTCLLFIVINASAQEITNADSFSVRVVADRLSDPWELIYGPDSALWITESKGYRVTRISPADGSRQVLLDLSAEKNFPRYDRIPDSSDGHKPWPQAGLMGMALHPRLLSTDPYVYLAYHYRFNGASEKGDGCLDRQGGCFFSTRIVRYTYNAGTKALESPVIVADSLPGSNDHNGGRLLIAPVEDSLYLFYSIGDMGAGQFVNAGRPNHAQDPTIYEGKILRFRLHPGHAGKEGGDWIPTTNPFHNAVYSLGHRNPQGLAFALIAGKEHLYSSEHGPFSDDEINEFVFAKNYGHPLVIGYADGNYDGLAAGATEHRYLPGKWHTTYPLVADEKQNAARLGNAYRDPLYSFCPTSNRELKNVLEKERKGKEVEWQSEAPAGIEVYTGDAIPGWKNSLLVTTLKGGKLFRLPLDTSGTKVAAEPVSYFKGPVRYRDLAISPDGLSIYLALDSTSVTSGPTEENPKAIAYRGVILEYRYRPAKQAADHHPDEIAVLPVTASRRKTPPAGLR